MRRLIKPGLSVSAIRRIAQIDLGDRPRTILFATDLVKGDIVDHYHFGRGEVVWVNDATYSLPLVNVFFYDYGENTIIRGANLLELVSDDEKTN